VQSVLGLEQQRVGGRGVQHRTIGGEPEADGGLAGRDPGEQLRGRVGRSGLKAWCLLLLDRLRPPGEDAKKRLKTLEEFGSLGAGFALASLILLPAVAQKIGMGSSLTIALRGALMRAANRL